MRNILLSKILSFCVSVLLFSLLSKEIRIWDVAGTTISPSFLFSALILIPLILLFSSLIYLKNNTINIRHFFDPIGFAYGLIIYVLSDFCSRGFNLFQGPSIRGEIICLSIAGLFFLSRIQVRFFKFFSIFSSLLLFILFISLSQNSPIISDDHASFIFRLNLLRDNFPNVPFYYPGWNAGLDARDFFATGAIGYFLLTWPLHYLLDISLSHNLSLAGVLFIILPVSLFSAARILKLSDTCAYIAASLSFSTSLVWYRWALKYGTLGFITSAALMPLIFALGYKLISGQKLSRFQLILFIGLGTISIMWPLGAFCYLALIIMALINVKKLFFKRQIWITAIFLLLLNLPWALIFWKVSSVGKFIQKPNPSTFTENVYRHEDKGLSLEQSLKVLRETANSTNPLLIFLAIPGILILPQGVSLIFSLQAWLFFLGGTILVTLKPQLELDRLLVFLSIFLCIPVAQSLSSLLRNYAQSKLIVAVSFSFLFLSPLIASNVLHNRSADNFRFSGTLTKDISSFIKSEASQGRFLFSGFVLHEMDGGHLAPLPHWTGKPLVASSPFHNKWKYTSIFPESFASRGEEGITRFLDLYNAEIIFAHEEIWRKFFEARPDKFELIWKNYPFRAYRRKNFVSNYFEQGSGQIESQAGNQIVLKVSSPNNIIKFNYFNFLSSTNCELSGIDFGLEFPLIELKNCDTSKPVVIKSVSAFERVLK